MANTPRLGMPEMTDSQEDHYATNNEEIRILDAIAQGGVLDKDLAIAPGSPSDGDAYIVGTSPSSDDDWNGHDDEIAYFSSTDWIFITPKPGFLVWVEDEEIFYVYKNDSDTWVTLTSVV